MTGLVFLDTETTGLDPTVEEVFEIAVVDLEGHEAVWRLEPAWSVVEAMHPKAAEVNQFHTRTTAPDWRWDDRDLALEQLATWLDGAHVVGAVPDFDTRFLTALYDRAGRDRPRWHYHLIDIETLAVGWLAGARAAVAESVAITGEAVWAGTPAWVAAEAPWPLDLPWRSDDLSRLVGVDPPPPDMRHTALGDARWCRQLWLHLVEWSGA